MKLARPTLVCLTVLAIAATANAATTTANIAGTWSLGKVLTPTNSTITGGYQQTCNTITASSNTSLTIQMYQAGSLTLGTGWSPSWMYITTSQASTAQYSADGDDAIVSITENAANSYDTVNPTSDVTYTNSDGLSATVTKATLQSSSDDDYRLVEGTGQPSSICRVNVNGNTFTSNCRDALGGGDRRRRSAWQDCSKTAPSSVTAAESEADCVGGPMVFTKTTASCSAYPAQTTHPAPKTVTQTATVALAVADYTGNKKTATETAYGLSVGICSSSGTYISGASVSSSARSSTRRSTSVISFTASLPIGAATPNVVTGTALKSSMDTTYANGGVGAAPAVSEVGTASITVTVTSSSPASSLPAWLLVLSAAATHVLLQH